MHNFVRQGLAMVLGGALVAAVLLGRGAIAQNEPAAQQSAPTTVDGILSTATQLSYQGQLSNNSGPVTGDVSIIFRIYDSAAGGSTLWTEAQIVQPDTNGIFSTMLGKQIAIDPGIFNGSDRWLGITVGGDSETAPRLALGATGYAMYAQNAGRFDGRTADTFSAIKREVVAYGIVDGANNCSRTKGHHFSSTRIILDNDPTCQITVRDRSDQEVSYNVNDYVTVVTPLRTPSCTNTRQTTTGSSNGKLLVDLYDSNGNHVDCKFHFMTFAFTTSGQPTE